MLSNKIILYVLVAIMIIPLTVQAEDSVPAGDPILFPIISVEPTNEALGLSFRLSLPDGKAIEALVDKVTVKITGVGPAGTKLFQFSHEFDVAGFGDVTLTFIPLPSGTEAEMFVDGVFTGFVGLKNGRTQFAITGQFNPMTHIHGRGAGGDYILRPVIRADYTTDVYDVNTGKTIDRDFYQITVYEP